MCPPVASELRGVARINASNSARQFPPPPTPAPALARVAIAAFVAHSAPVAAASASKTSTTPCGERGGTLSARGQRCLHARVVCKWETLQWNGRRSREQASHSLACVQMGLQTHSSPPVTIRVLDKAVIQRIAAGEVMGSLAAVVCELVENAIDAGASRIVVEVHQEEDGGLSVSVHDNGAGMCEQDVPRCAECNATSKLRTVQELAEGVSTLGFRGQALWAAAEVCEQLTVASRCADAQVATMASFRGDGSCIPESIRGVARTVGTTVRLSRLRPQLWNGQRRPTAAVAQAQLLVKDTAVIYPHVAFEFHMRSAKSPRIWKVGAVHSSRERCAERWDLLHASSLLSLVRKFNLGGDERSQDFVGHVRVVMAPPDRMQMSSARHMLVAINGRVVLVPTVLRRLVQEAMKRNVATGKFPAILVQLDVPSRWVNWNLHPSKHTFGLLLEPELEASFYSAVREAVSECAGAHVAPAEPSQLIDTLIRRKEQVRGSSSAETPARRWTLQGVLFNTYLVAETNGLEANSVVLIEQHVAHERVLFENFKQCLGLDAKATRGAALPFPVRVENVLLPSAPERLAQLLQFGFNFANYDELIQEAALQQLEGMRSALYDLELTSVPFPDLESQDGDTLRRLIMIGASDLGSFESVLADLACRAAIRNGQPPRVCAAPPSFTDEAREKVRYEWYQSLLDDLSECILWRTCPHGRPVAYEIAETELARLFNRNYSPLTNGTETERSALLGSRGKDCDV
ncbi:DNA mismatch repair protein MutL [Porphyridium purpureum]|uniref:DNA mismatch repair protein MutL n=1 Tax=Porphyridium purpureum TaxID=35688 RepID=A0A5J4Z3B9_PORPP|nr:DNA mismatch repair protein MutL [Porphyridium purpureum]|eukprot:POR9235..scf208_2